jgi:hypothetical protein
VNSLHLRTDEQKFKKADIRGGDHERRQCGRSRHLSKISDVRFDPDCCRQGYFSNVPNSDAPLLLTVGLQSESLPSLGAEGPFIAALQTGC